jgi:integrase
VVERLFWKTRAQRRVAPALRTAQRRLRLLVRQFLRLHPEALPHPPWSGPPLLEHRPSGHSLRPAGVVLDRQIASSWPPEAKVGGIVSAFLAAKQADGLSRRYIETLRTHLNRFAGGFDTRIDRVTTAQIEQWLRSRPLSPRARNNFRGSIITLFRFARKQGYLPKGQPTEADDTARAKDRGGKIGILKPEDLARVLPSAPQIERLFLSLGAFTGMRSSEILRLDWEDLNFERNFIIVAAEKTKTATRRLVPILPNLRAWVLPLRRPSGQLFNTRRDADRAIAFAKSCQVVWPNNALRHSYATYRLALTADAARVALEMGNSPQKLMTHYRELADTREAELWFGIHPKTMCQESEEVRVSAPAPDGAHNNSGGPSQ